MSTNLKELMTLRSGGAYVPPGKLRALMADVELEQNSEEVQKLQWDNLRKKINSIINKVNKDNIKIMVIELFKLNLLRGKGLLCNSLIKSQQLSNSYTDVYSSLVCVINSKLPEIGNLLIRRLIIKYNRLFRREDLDQCRSIVVFLSELVVFKVCAHKLIIEIIDQLIENPNDFKIEIIITILNHCGIVLYDNEGVWFDNIKNTLRHVLGENIVDTKSQFLIQEFFDTFRSKFEKGTEISDDLDLVEEEDCIVHTLSIKDRPNGEAHLDIFHFDENYSKNNEKYNSIKHDILGSDIEDDSEDDKSEEGGDFSSDNDVEESDEDKDIQDNKLTVQIKDLTEQELTNYQKNVYLTIMSSMSPDEATHKLLKLPPIDPQRKEYMLIDMIIKCCAQEKVYSKYYGIIGENLIVINDKWNESFNEVFKENYINCHKYETSLLRNLGAFWGHMLGSDKLGWECFSIIKLTEEDTTSSSRILIKFIFQKMIEEIGISKLLERVNEPYIQEYISGIFPSENAENLRFSINFFTAIGMGKLTDKMRECLDALPINADAIEDGNETDTSESSRGRRISRSMSPDRDCDYSRSRSASASPVGGNNERGRSYHRDDRRRSESYSRSRSASPIGNHGNNHTRERYYNNGDNRNDYKGEYRDDYRGDYDRRIQYKKSSTDRDGLIDYNKEYDERYYYRDNYRNQNRNNSGDVDRGTKFIPRGPRGYYGGGRGRGRGRGRGTGGGRGRDSGRGRNYGNDRNRNDFRK